MSSLKSDFNKHRKLIVGGGLLLMISLVFAFANPFGYNEAGEREVVETPGGEVWTHFENGMYWKGFFSKTITYPNILTVASTGADESKSAEHEYATAIGDLDVRFNDGSTADCEILARFMLPNDNASMVQIHKDYRTPQGLVNKGLKPFAGEALRGSAQLLSSEMHYSGGRSQMSQYFQDQLDYGLYLLDTKEETNIDTISGEEKTHYITKIRLKNGQPVRKKSSLVGYGITIAEALIADVDYEDKIDLLLAAKIKSQTEASIAKTQLVTAQQQQETAVAKGKQKLIEIEYANKEVQTKAEVEAQTTIILAKADIEKQKAAVEGAKLEAQKIKLIADAEAYAKHKIMVADGALDKKLEAYKTVQEYWANAFGAYKGAIVPTTVMGGSNSNGQNGATTFMEIMGMKAAQDLNLNLKTK
jgi:regulator of protease activity HflC (stomatin/prohibitin superfamily)